VGIYVAISTVISVHVKLNYRIYSEKSLDITGFKIFIKAFILHLLVLIAPSVRVNYRSKITLIFHTRRDCKQWFQILMDSGLRKLLNHLNLTFIKSHWREE